MAGLTGRCMCGAVRYELRSAPFDCGYCHCRTCQLNSGAPAMVFTSVSSGDLVWTLGGEGAVGALIQLRSSRVLRRMRNALPDEGRPSAGDGRFQRRTLDDPEAVAPGFHIFWGSRIGWLEPKDELPRHEKFRPDTRGLEGTDPPE